MYLVPLLLLQCDPQSCSLRSPKSSSILVAAHTVALHKSISIFSFFKPRDSSSWSVSSPFEFYYSDTVLTFRMYFTRLRLS